MTGPNDPETANKPIHLTPIELAERLHLTRRTLDHWRGTGSGPPFIKFGKHVLYRVEDVERWEASMVRKSTAEHKASG